MSPLSWFLVAVITWVVLCPVLVYVLLTRKSIPMADARSAAFRATVYGPYAVFDAMTTSQEKIDQRKAHKVALVQAQETKQAEEREAQARKRADHEAQIAQYTSGELPSTPAAGIVRASGETFVYEGAGFVGLDVQSKHWESGYQGVSVPLGHGFRYRVSGGAGHNVTQTGFEWSEKAMLYVSNLRIVYRQGNTQFLSIPLTQILTYDKKPDGVEVMVSGHGRVYFRCWDEYLGIVVERLLKP